MPWMIVGVIIKAGQACLHCIIVSRVHVVVYIARKEEKLKGINANVGYVCSHLIASQRYAGS